jgi:hypothetical protein
LIRALFLSEQYHGLEIFPSRHDQVNVVGYGDKTYLWAGIVTQAIKRLPSKCEFKPQYHQKQTKQKPICHAANFQLNQLV